MAVRATVSRFPIDADAQENSGLPWGVSVTPFASKDENGRPPAYGSDAHLLPRCEHCWAYFNSYCDLEHWAWTCALCGTLNGLSSKAIARFSNPESCPEMMSSFIDLELPDEGSGGEAMQSRPVYVAAIDLSLNLAAAEHPAQNQEADITPVLSTRTSLRRLLSLEALVEGIQATLQEVLQWLETLAPPQILHEDCQEFVQEWGQRGIQGAGFQRVGRNLKKEGLKCKKEERYIKIKSGSDFFDQSFLIHIFVERISFVIPCIRIQKILDLRLHKKIVDRTPKWHFLLIQFFFTVQDYQELPPKFQDYYQEPQEWSSSDDEPQESYDGTTTIGIISKIDQASSDQKSLAAVQALLINQGPPRSSDIPWDALIGKSVSIATAQSGSVGSESSSETAWRAESESLKSLLTGAPQSKLSRIALVDGLAHQILNGIRAVALQFCRELEDKFLQHIATSEGAGWKIVDSFEGNFPNRIKQLPLDRHFDNVKRIVLEADGYQPYLIFPEKASEEFLELTKSALLAALEALGPGSLFGLATFSHKLGLYDVQGPIPVVKNVFIPPDTEGALPIELEDVMPLLQFLAPVETCKDRIEAALETLRPTTSWERTTAAGQGIDGILMGGRGFGVAMEALLNYLGSEYGNIFALGKALIMMSGIVFFTSARIFAFLSGPPDYGAGQLDTRRYGEQYASKGEDADRALLPEQTPFYKELAAVAVQAGVCVDIFAVTNEYTDLASLKFLSIESGGSLCFYPSTDDSTLPQDM
ncbi:protein transport protein sec24 [Cucumis melo var. makuwa]|uniref:Protein transport protein sec24 n=1 Tax=Cucumis melo var. makuwa TaxID=1194695 RepID=A0A5D3E4P3_CUCMM|nr:protein transport protein sec24 [Cucumis melo var. makuwa]